MTLLNRLLSAEPVLLDDDDDDEDDDAAFLTVLRMLPNTLCADALERVKAVMRTAITIFVRFIILLRKFFMYAEGRSFAHGQGAELSACYAFGLSLLGFLLVLWESGLQK